MDESQNRDKIEEELKDKFQECLVGVDYGIGSLQDMLKQAEKEIGEAYHWFDLVIEQKKEIR